MNTTDRLQRNGAARSPLTDRPSWSLLADVTEYDGDGYGYGQSRVVRILFPSSLSDDQVTGLLSTSGFDIDGNQCACAYTGRDCCGQWFSNRFVVKRGRRFVVATQQSAMDV